ncbi:MAG: hypothetical protein F6J93_39860 [Oscillatoria sp. SIO1A7]|nr:hypothetical protein [Oscillatoria sp. SIO1A7]
MKIYVQSRGRGQDEDYCWLRVTSENSQDLEVPAAIAKVSHLIQSESPSLVLARYDRELLLLLTGMEAKERTDLRGRKIRNSVAWVVEDSEENEQKLRAIAANYLQELLSDNIDKAIQFGGEYGFEVCDRAILEMETIEKASNGDTKLECRLGKNSEDLRELLAYELESRRLPEDNGPLVVVTGIKSESTLKEAGVWRGLSNLVKPDSVKADRWKEPYKKSLESGEEEEKSAKTAAANPAITLAGILIGGLGIFYLLLLLFQ